ncbi:glycosyl hydrolase family 18 protein [Streptomyces sp. NPDC046821]|uniref:glycoside hydrolase family 18 protein n=1 Tax=Streptomyces sp. NPDC046821 TaxID=3154702 RepID=UPI003411C87D
MRDLVNTPDPGMDVDGSIRGEGAAEKTYAVNQFDPARETSKLSYTPRRSAKTVFNTYQRGTSPLTLSGYVEADSAYDSRYHTVITDDYRQGGPGADVAQIPGDAFDELVVGTLGIIGEQGRKGCIINQAALLFKIASSEADLPNQRGRVTFTDAWGDVLAHLGFGFSGDFSDDVAGNFTAAKAKGLLGAMTRLKKDHPNLKVGLNVGGWEFSEAFHHIAKEPTARTKFADSIAQIFRAFPMFSTVHLDWQFPDSPGAPGNAYGPQDVTNYAELIRVTKSTLDPLVADGVTIAVSAPGTAEEIRAMNIPALINAGATRINLLAYDYFGTPWSPSLGHHSPLRHTPQASHQHSVDAAVTYLVQEAKVDPGLIHLAYTTHSRNAHHAELTQTSPLKGPYAHQGETVGTFESGTTTLADAVRNYLDLEAGAGRNGFTLHTDTDADADYLYNPDSGIFMSLDTPRSVKAKAEYARTNKLGGMYAVRADADTGLLANAAREGLGHTITDTVVDMKPLYVTGSH